MALLPEEYKDLARGNLPKKAKEMNRWINVCSSMTECFSDDEHM
jgi:hypothetical protein